MTEFQVFRLACEAISNGKLIHRENVSDKEFHFQNWCSSRLEETKKNFECGGRNSYPDFRLVNEPLGFEIKGLAYPGRWKSYDSNSQIPSGVHRGRTVYYFFGRYPKKPDGNDYPVLDLVICHGDFLNADSEYEHENKSIKGFGSYGDILIRDRKMYVVPTPFALAQGLAHRQTLIVPSSTKAPEGFQQVGELVRVESKELIVGYTFDLVKNILIAKTIPNPKAGTKHTFHAWRLADAPKDAVTITKEPIKLEDELDDADDEGATAK
jgi:hypothetical protein